MSYENLYSTGEMARKLNVPTYRVDNTIRSRRIDPTFCAGGRKFYDDKAIERIGAVLCAIDERKRQIREEREKCNGNSV